MQSHGSTMLSVFRTVPKVTVTLMVLVCLSHRCGAQAAEWKSGVKWVEPKVVDAGPPGGPPADAIVLFDGKDLSQWNGGERWIVQDGFAICRGGGITTKQAFGDCQLHVEWASPSEVKGHGQGRGNNGVYLMGQYEVQVLDSYENKTYYDGQAGAVYKQHPPLVNVCRKPGEWQTFDIIFTAPKFDEQGKLTSPAVVTLLHNGVLIQNHFELTGATAWHKPPEYKAHPPKLPLHLQYHGNPVRFRNIWIRELGLTPEIEPEQQTPQQQPAEPEPAAEPKAKDAQEDDAPKQDGQADK